MKPLAITKLTVSNSVCCRFWYILGVEKKLEARSFWYLLGVKAKILNKHPRPFHLAWAKMSPGHFSPGWNVRGVRGTFHSGGHFSLLHRHYRLSLLAALSIRSASCCCCCRCCCCCCCCHLWPCFCWPGVLWQRNPTLPPSEECMLGIAVSANSDLSCGVNRSELAQKDGIYQKDVYSRPCCNREHCRNCFTLRQHMRNFSGESLSRVAWTFCLWICWL